MSRSPSTASSPAGLKKLGQPVADSNLASDSNSSAPQPAHRNVPPPFSSLYSFDQGRSVPLRRRISYCSGVSSRRHSSSVLFTLAGMRPPPCLEVFSSMMHNHVHAGSATLRRQGALAGFDRLRLMERTASQRVSESAIPALSH